MFDNILVGVDGRRGGHDAIALATALAAPSARITLAHIYGEVSEGPPGPGSMLLADQRAGAEEMLAHERAEHCPAADAFSAYGTSVGHALHHLAEQRSFDLIVVGSCHHGVVGRVLMGDDTRAAFDGAPCAIAVAPCHYSARPRSIRSIAVGYEGTPESEQALAAARYVADRTGAVIVATWVVVLQKVQAHGPLPADWDADTAKLVEQCQEHLDGIEGVIGHAVYGGPREELSRVSSGHDLVVVGSRAHGAWGHLFHGSVSSYLEHHCAAPLMIMARDLQTEHRPAIEQTAEPEAVTR